MRLLAALSALLVVAGPASAVQLVVGDVPSTMAWTQDIPVSVQVSCAELDADTILFDQTLDFLLDAETEGLVGLELDEMVLSLAAGECLLGPDDVLVASTFATLDGQLIQPAFEPFELTFTAEPFGPGRNAVEEPNDVVRTTSMYYGSGVWPFVREAMLDDDEVHVVLEVFINGNAPSIISFWPVDGPSDVAVPEPITIQPRGWREATLIVPFAVFDDYQEKTWNVDVGGHAVGYPDDTVETHPWSFTINPADIGLPDEPPIVQGSEAKPASAPAALLAVMVLGALALLRRR